MQFGGYNIEKYAKKGLTESDIHWAPLTNNKYYWTLNIGETFKIGDETINLHSNTKYIILDSGMSLGMIPQRDYNKITEFLFQHYAITFSYS